MTKNDNDAWLESLFKAKQGPENLAKFVSRPPQEKGVSPAALWLRQLFHGSTADSGGLVQVIRQGRIVGEFALSSQQPRLVIGRHPQADIQLDAPKMSMYQAAITCRSGRYYIEDLGSERGSQLNGKVLSARAIVALSDGDSVTLPGHALKFLLPGSQTEPPVAGYAAAKVEQAQASRPKLCFQPLPAGAGEQRETVALWTQGPVALKVAEIIEETRDTKTFRLVGEHPLQFSYRPGQFVTLMLHIDGQDVQRSYSMSSSPSRPHCLELTVKRLPGGLVSNWLCNNVKPGDTLTLKGPGGKFSCMDFPAKKLLFIGAGSGITPLMSMSRWLVDTAAGVDVKFLVSAKWPSAIIFRKELEHISARHSGFRVAVTVTSNWSGTEAWTGFTGRIGANIINIVVPDLHERHVFVCGPEAFMDDMKALLKRLNFPMQNFHSESFGGKRVVQGVRPDVAGIDVKHRLVFKHSQIVVQADEAHTVLELAEMHGVELDYSCRAGYCGECMVQCKGEVAISSECDIDDSHRRDGYIYACCTRAKADLEIEA